MNFQFNPAQLSRCQQNSLMDVLGVIQSENKDELIVTPVEFPNKLKVKLDDDIEMLLGWDADKQSYAGLTTPEHLEQDIKDLAKETVQPETESETKGVLICCLDMDGKVIPSGGLGPDIDPIELARLKYELMVTHLNMSEANKVIFAKDYSRLWSEHR